MNLNVSLPCMGRLHRRGMFVAELLCTLLQRPPLIISFVRTTKLLVLEVPCSTAALACLKGSSNCRVPTASDL